jgi:hypothetical protein
MTDMYFCSSSQKWMLTVLFIFHQHWQAIIDKHEAKPEHPCVATYEVIEAYASLGELEVAVKLLEDKFAAYAEAPVSYAKIQGGRAFEYEAAATLRAEANIRQSTQETRAFIGLIYCCVRVSLGQHVHLYRGGLYYGQSPWRAPSF